MSASSATFNTAFITSDSLPTPEGSMMIRSGANWLYVLQSGAEIAHQRAADATGVHLRDLHTGIFKSRRRYFRSHRAEFSMRTIYWLFSASSSNFLINVVFPAPRNPEIMSIFVMLILLYLEKLIVSGLPACRTAIPQRSPSVYP